MSLTYELTRITSLTHKLTREPDHEFDSRVDSASRIMTSLTLTKAQPSWVL